MQNLAVGSREAPAHLPSAVSTGAAAFLGDHTFLCGYSVFPSSTVMDQAAEMIVFHSSSLIYSEGWLCSRS
jgi:hypothetical protein